MDTYNIEMPIDLQKFPDTIKNLIQVSNAKVMKGPRQGHLPDTVRCIGFIDGAIDTIGEMKIYPSDIFSGIFRADGKVRAHVQRFMVELSTSQNVQIEIYNEEENNK